MGNRVRICGSPLNWGYCIFSMDLHDWMIDRSPRNCADQSRVEYGPDSVKNMFMSQIRNVATWPEVVHRVLHGQGGLCSIQFEALPPYSCLKEVVPQFKH